MDNEILRHKNKSTLDESVSVASFGEKKVKNTGNQTNTLLSFFKSERKDIKGKLELENSIPVEKPKLLEPISLFIELITISALLIYFCLSVNNLFFTVVLITFTSAIVPLFMVFFFYRLNTRWKIKSSLIIQLLSLGIGIYLLLEVAFDKFINYNSNYSSLISPLKGIVEICVVLFIVGFIVKGLKQYNVMSILLIACIVSAGFSIARSLVESFETMFIRVQVSNNGITSALGAIINSSESVELSVKTLLRNLLNLSIFKPAIFISLAVINGFVLRHMLFKKTNEKTPFGLVFLLLFTIVTMAFSSLTSSIKFLQVLYISISVVATGYALYRVIEYSVKNENYI